MQFIVGGPDVPQSLLDAHEAGQVVFFCGAGISYGASLPGFKGLVDEIYVRLNTVLTDIEESTYKSKRFDLTLDHLERRIQGDRLAMRRALFKSLRPNYDLHDSTVLHESLLSLSRNREGFTHLVTTNFDRIFEVVLEKKSIQLKRSVGPKLPIPKGTRWNELVYLHGLLPEEEDDHEALNNLVITSGDFGLAYLSERWASRFITEMFRNFTVCFVGYSIDDPIIRYMMDALAADQMRNQDDTRPAYAFGSFAKNNRESEFLRWKSKGVVPILYEILENNSHENLIETFNAWSILYRQEIKGKIQIIKDYALSQPSKANAKDDFVGRVRWALNDSTGIPAKHFSTLVPVPSLEWLEFISGNGLQLDILVSPKFKSIRLDGNIKHLANWLIRHLGDPNLILWVANHDSHLNVQWANMIEMRFHELHNYKTNGEDEKMEDITRKSPNAFPSDFLTSVWSLILAGKSLAPQKWRSYTLKNQFTRYGLTTAVRQEILNWLRTKDKDRSSHFLVFQ